MLKTTISLPMKRRCCRVPISNCPDYMHPKVDIFLQQAQAPRTFRNVTINLSVLTDKRSLKWQASNETGLAGDELVWRSVR